MQIKKGVKIEGVRDPIFLAMLASDKLWLSYNVKEGVVLTSVMDGTHKKGSKHYTGDAIDIRIWNLPENISYLQASSDLRTLLGRDYDVVLEKDHIHIEWDPK